MEAAARVGDFGAGEHVVEGIGSLDGHGRVGAVVVLRSSSLARNARHLEGVVVADRVTAGVALEGARKRHDVVLARSEAEARRAGAVARGDRAHDAAAGGVDERSERDDARADRQRDLRGFREVEQIPVGIARAGVSPEGALDGLTNCDRLGGEATSRVVAAAVEVFAAELDLGDRGSRELARHEDRELDLAGARIGGAEATDRDVVGDATLELDALDERREVGAASAVVVAGEHAVRRSAAFHHRDARVEAREVAGRHAVDGRLGRGEGVDRSAVDDVIAKRAGIAETREVDEAGLTRRVERVETELQGGSLVAVDGGVERDAQRAGAGNGRCAVATDRDLVLSAGLEFDDGDEAGEARAARSVVVAGKDASGGIASVQHRDLRVEARLIAEREAVRARLGRGELVVVGVVDLLGELQLAEARQINDLAGRGVREQVVAEGNLHGRGAAAAAATATATARSGDVERSSAGTVGAVSADHDLVGLASGEGRGREALEAARIIVAAEDAIVRVAGVEDRDARIPGRSAAEREGVASGGVGGEGEERRVVDGVRARAAISSGHQELREGNVRRERVRADDGVRCRRAVLRKGCAGKEARRHRRTQRAHVSQSHPEFSFFKITTTRFRARGPCRPVQTVTPRRTTPKEDRCEEVTLDRKMSKAKVWEVRNLRRRMSHAEPRDTVRWSGRGGIF